jgi:hypothetical protein
MKILKNKVIIIDSILIVSAVGLILLILLLSGYFTILNISKSLKDIQNRNQLHIEKALKRIEVNKNDKTLYTIKIKPESLKGIRSVTDSEYKDFLIKYYETQSNTINIWLSGLTILLALTGFVAPLFFMKLYQDKNEEITNLITRMEKQKEKFDIQIKDMDKIIDETKKQKEDMQLQVDKVYSKYNSILKESKDVGEKYDSILKESKEINKKSEKMSKDLETVKRYYEETKAESEYTEIYNQYKDNKKDNEKLKNKLEHILRVKPKHIGACTLLACIYSEEHNYITAKEYALKAYKYSGQNKGYLYNVIETLLFNEEFDNAVKYMKQYKKYKYAKIYKDDYDKWLNQIEKIQDEKLRNTATNILSNLPKMNR